MIVKNGILDEVFNLLNKAEFFKKYKIDTTEYEQLNLDWEDLIKIYDHYNRNIKIFKTIASTISEILRENSEVHSIRSRVKDPEHLVNKVIRKTIRERKKSGNEEFVITIENYLNEITDIVGIRVLHLYKDQAFKIDQMIREEWDLHEVPTINYRDGDILSSVLTESGLFDTNKHEAGYRSWHYLIKTKITKKETIAEIQVRTIFEEGWSEIDHRLRYPLDVNNSLLNNQLLVFNRLAGNADEMANSIRETKENLAEMNKEKIQQQELIDEMKKEIDQLYEDQEIKEDQMISLNDKIARLEESQKRTYVSTEEFNSSNIIQNYRTESIFGDNVLLNTLMEESPAMKVIRENTLSNSYYESPAIKAYYESPAIKAYLESPAMKAILDSPAAKILNKNINLNEKSEKK